MIDPHGSKTLNPLFVADAAKRASLEKEAQKLPAVVVSSGTAANAVMLASGYFNPLTGYMNLDDAISVAKSLKTKGGLFWPVPVMNVIKDASGIKGAKRIALKDPNVEGQPVLAVQTVEKIEEASEAQLKEIAQEVFGTLDEKHPGVQAFLSQGRFVVSGPIEVLSYSYFDKEFPETFRTAQQLRDEISKRGWKTVVAFQTRNPMHRAHEELCKMAKDAVNADGILIHMLLGKLKEGDIPAPIRDTAIRTMVKHYFPENSVLIAGYGFDMLYAGPREAVLHAVFRQNAGCTHFIIGRDHAGVGSYYGPFEAQEIFDKKVPADALKIKIFRADHTAFSKKLGRVVMMRDVPDHKPEDFVILSGTKVRQMLAAGQDLPPEFARPEVARTLMAYYKELEAAGAK